MNAGYLVLEDGTVFPGPAVGAPGIAAARPASRRDGRLRGGGHRPELRRPGALLQPTRSSATTASTRRAWSRSASGRGRRHARASGPSRGVARGAGRRRARGRRHARARPRIRDGRDAVRARRGADPDELLARALAEPPIDERGRSTAHRRSARGSRTRSGRAARRGPRPRLQALDPAAPRRGGARGARRARPLGRRRDPRGRRAAVWSGTARATRPARRTQVETVRDLLGRVPALRHLPRPPAARARARPADVQAAVRAPRREPSRARPRTGRVLVTVQNHGFAVAPTTPTSSHVSLNDGTVEGLEGDGFSTVSSTPRRRPGRSTPCPSSTGSRTRACRSAPTFARS